jgi:hypothetical protein
MKSGHAKLRAAAKRLFSATFDLDEPLPEHVTVRRDDLETLLLCWKENFTEPAVPGKPTLHPAQQ